MPDVRLQVNGLDYGGWTNIRVTRGIEAIAGQFDLSVSERWNGQTDPWPIIEEDECIVSVDGTPLLTGYVDTRSIEMSGSSHSFGVSGRDKTGALVDSSAVLGKYEFAKTGVLELCEQLAAPFGIEVFLQDGLDDAAISTTGRKKTKLRTPGGRPDAVGSAGESSSMRLTSPNAKFTINPGDSAFEVMDRACRLVGVLPVSDGVGGLVLTRTGGKKGTTSLVWGENVLGATVTFDAARRYRRYIVSGQGAGSNDIFGPAAAAVSAEAQDPVVRRGSRVLLIRPEGAVTLAFARQRAAWEATTRAARSVRVSVSVQGWTQQDGSLWPINSLVEVHLPKHGIEHRELLITEVMFLISPEQGTTTQLTLARKDAFLPEPTIPPTSGSGGATAFLGN